MTDRNVLDVMSRAFARCNNRMAPSFSSKNGVRYRFYVSTALHGRKHKAGSVTRVSAREIESLVEEAVQKKSSVPDGSGDAISERVERIIVGDTRVRIIFSKDHADGAPGTFEIPWTRTTGGQVIRPPADAGRKPDQKLIQAVVRAHAWLAELETGRFSSIEELAAASKLHPKVVRQALRLGV